MLTSEGRLCVLCLNSLPGPHDSAEQRATCPPPNSNSGAGINVNVNLEQGRAATISSIPQNNSRDSLVLQSRLYHTPPPTRKKQQLFRYGSGRRGRQRSRGEASFPGEAGGDPAARARWRRGSAPYATALQRKAVGEGEAGGAAGPGVVSRVRHAQDSPLHGLRHGEGPRAGGRSGEHGQDSCQSLSRTGSFLLHDVLPF